jgi:hypothetical protein
VVVSRFAKFVLCAVLASVPLLAACGSSSTYKPTKDEVARRTFSVKADTICVATNKVTDDTQPKTLSQIPAAADTLVPAQRAQLVALRGLAVPEVVKPAWNRVLTLLDQQVTLLTQIQAGAGKTITIREASRDAGLLNAATVEGQQRATALGMPNCGT